MLYQLLITVVAMAVLMGGYYLVQRGLRRVCPEATRDYDVLEDRWGCGGCMLHGHCELELEPDAEAHAG
jgi:hypothetical protein